VLLGKKLKITGGRHIDTMTEIRLLKDRFDQPWLVWNEDIHYSQDF
jgi:hypothetical protein